MDTAPIILGIDPGINTGIAMIFNGKAVYADVHTKGKRSLESHANIVTTDIMGLLSGFINITIDIAIETATLYASLKNKKAVEQLIYYRGLLIGGLLQTGTVIRKINQYSPMVWKGQTPKDIHNARCLEYIPNLKNVIHEIPLGKQNHAVDAAGIAYFHYKGVRI